MRSVLWMAVMLVLSSSAAVRANSIAKENCRETCGEVSVPYPFGIGKPECAKNFSFWLNCTDDRLFVSNAQIYNISLKDGTLTAGIFPAYDCYNESGLSYEFNQTLNLSQWPFTISPSTTI
ncbi:hypothetical protein SLA2020_483820 [Shorea laevis]